jgi:hypothetical protein
MSSSSHGVMHILDSGSNKARPLKLTNDTLLVNNSANTQPISAAALPLPSGAASELAQVAGNSSLTSMASSLSNIELNNATASNQSTANSSLSNIESSLTGTLSVSQSVSKASTTVNSASSVASSDYSAPHDASNHRKVAIFGTTTDNSNNIDVYVSQDNSTYYKFGNFNIFPASGGDFSLMMDAPFKYVKLRYNGSATVTALICGSN